MKSKEIFIITILMMLFLTACSAPKKNIFVLVPDPDGKTGQIAVENQGGTLLIDKPWHVTEVKDSATPPAPSRPMEEKEIQNIFGAALSAQPLQPVTYILNFKTGGADLTEESEKKLPEILATVTKRKSSDISVVGHSDTVGTKEINYEISFKRAQRVKEILIGMGADPILISIDSHGEDNLLVKTQDEVAEPKNRRVEVTIR
ncbi:MAG: OmpA family protein [Smithellaceae bacterium]|nr:OmpA family protein [Smithellaceae bacterium]